ncbi:MAG: hypothetical protein U5K29_15045 [Acidimicrobiales bacterium]|nr:hypothetical protein [Acidimicrobiales bacterium]
MSDVLIIVIGVLLGAFVKGVTGSGLPVGGDPRDGQPSSGSRRRW